MNAHVDSCTKLVRIAGLLLITVPAFGQIEEPILTKSAQVFAPTSGALKLDYAGSLIQTGASAQIVPEFTLQAGVTRRWEGLLRFPLLRIQPENGPAFLAGGQLAAGGKFLVVGGPGARTTISVQGVVEAPTGDSHAVGNATQIMPTILADWHVVRHLVTYTNVGWDVSLGGTGPRVSILAYQTAAVLASPHRLRPALEFAGSTNTNTGRTLAVLQPDLLFRQGAHLEMKVGVSSGLNSRSPTLSLHAQLAIFWGES